MDEKILQDIRESPEDDTARLVYADLLMERANEQGEYIALTCRLARLPAGDPAAGALRERAERLLHEHGAKWIGELTTLTQDRDFERGMIRRIQVGTVPEFLARAEEIFALAPAVDALNIAQPVSVAEMTAFAGSPWLARIRTLDFKPITRNGHRSNAQSFTRPHFLALGASPHVTGLLALGMANVSGEGPLVEGLGALARSSARLRKLNLVNNRLDPACMAILAANPAFADLRELRIGGNGSLGDDGIVALARSSTLLRIMTLGLANNGFGREGIAALAASRVLAPCRALELGNNTITNTGAEQLAASPHLANLVSLEISSAHIGQLGADAIRRAPFFARLTHFNCRGNAGKIQHDLPDPSPDQAPDFAADI